MWTNEVVCVCVFVEFVIAAVLACACSGYSWRGCRGVQFRQATKMSGPKVLILGGVG